LEFLARAIRQEEKIKRTQIGKKVVKPSLLEDDVILYLKSSKKNSTQKLLDTINSFNLQESVAFLNTKNEKLRKNSPKGK
jgi:hypothetical protein